jgi:cytoskeleton protein RodZ
MGRLKDVREQSGLTASDVARVTCLSPRTITLIEAERFDELPAGIYVRSWLREYARAIGLAPDAVIDELRPRLPDAPVDLRAIVEQRASLSPASFLPYEAALAIDAVVLVSIWLTILAVCTTVVSVPLADFVRAEPTAVAILLAVPATLYFWLLGGSGLRTLGPWLLDLELLPRCTRSLSLDEWWQRGLEYLAREFTWALKRHV